MSKKNTTDHRRNKVSEPTYWVVCIDTFMSGWGLAPGLSYFAIAVDNHHEAERVKVNLKAEKTFRRVHIAPSLPTIRPEDHLSLKDRHSASLYFKEVA